MKREQIIFLIHVNILQIVVLSPFPSVKKITELSDSCQEIIANLFLDVYRAGLEKLDAHSRGQTRLQRTLNNRIIQGETNKCQIA